MGKVLSFLLFLLYIQLAFSDDDHVFMDQVSRRKSRSRLKKEYEQCKQRLHSDIPSGNKIENFDVSGLRRRSSFASLDSEEDDKPRTKVIRWPRGEVPVKLEPGFTKEEQTSLKCAILYFRAHTCLTFLTKKKRHEDYLYLMKTHKKGGCFTDVIGKKGGRQILNLDPLNDHCWEHGTIIHELMHVLGFFHEHSRSDRNNHLVIHWSNIPKAFHFQYWSTADMGYEHEDVGQYDFGSLMHYGRYLGFNLALSAKVKNDNYEQQAEDNDAMGQRIEPSDEDTNKLNLMYCPQLAILSSLDCKDELDCSGFVSLCQISELVSKKCKKTCGCGENVVKDMLSSLTYPATTTTTTTTTTVPTTTTPRIRADYRCGEPFDNAICGPAQCCNYGNWCGGNRALCYPSNGGTLDIKVRSDYRCGSYFNDAPCDPKQCCNVEGWCDRNRALCLPSNGGTLDIRVRSDYRCGSYFNDAPCDPTQCCSAEGWCDSKNCIDVEENKE